MSQDSTVYLPALLAPVLERWRRIVLVIVIAGLVGGGLTRVRAPRYVASMKLATISGSRSVNLGGAAALLGGLGGAQGGFQLSPALIADLLRSRRVLTEVGRMTIPGQSGDFVFQLTGRPVPAVDVSAVMKGVVDATVDAQTGLVELAVTARDSALARLIAIKTLQQTTHAFVETAKSQATQQRRAQEARVDSATYQLRQAEMRLSDFMTTNRGFSVYASASLRKQALDRDVLLAQSVYTQAVNDRETAKARELEETPVVVIVDSLPSDFPRKPRYTLIAATAAALVALLVYLLAIFVGEQLRRRGEHNDPDVVRVRAALDTLPGSKLFRRGAPATGRPPSAPTS